MSPPYPALVFIFYNIYSELTYYIFISSSTHLLFPHENVIFVGAWAWFFFADTSVSVRQCWASENTQYIFINELIRE